MAKWINSGERAMESQGWDAEKTPLEGTNNILDQVPQSIDDILAKIENDPSIGAEEKKFKKELALRIDNDLELKELLSSFSQNKSIESAQEYIDYILLDFESGHIFLKLLLGLSQVSERNIRDMFINTIIDNVLESEKEIAIGLYDYFIQSPIIWEEEKEIFRQAQKNYEVMKRQANENFNRMFNRMFMELTGWRAIPESIFRKHKKK